MTGASKPLVLQADAEGIAHAAKVLQQGGLVALPTETVYGLAARADDAPAVARIYRAKGRPDFNPLIVHVPDLATAGRLAQLDDRAAKLAEAFWPGALTMVLKRREDAGLAPAVTAGLPSVALRCPAHPVMQAVLSACGLPIAAPSANRSGCVSPTSAAHVVQSLGDKVDCVLEGGPCAAGIESTIVALRDFGWQLLRPGPITSERITAVLGSEPIGPDSDQPIEAPGQLFRHYAPGKPVRLEAQEAEADEFHIGFGAVQGEYNLSASADLEAAAAALYEALHQASASSKPRIAVARVPSQGIGIAINDRLRRAAS